jgi:hypothetical protein
MPARWIAADVHLAAFAIPWLERRPLICRRRRLQGADVALWLACRWTHVVVVDGVLFGQQMREQIRPYAGSLNV